MRNANNDNNFIRFIIDLIVFVFIFIRVPISLSMSIYGSVFGTYFRIQLKYGKTLTWTSGPTQFRSLEFTDKMVARYLSKP